MHNQSEGPAPCAFRETWCAQGSRSWLRCSSHLDLAAKRSSHGSASQTARKKCHPGLDNKKCARLLFDITNMIQPRMVLRSTLSRRGSTPDSGHPTCWEWHVDTSTHASQLACHIAATWTCVVLMPHCMVLQFRPDRADIAHDVQQSSQETTVLQTIRLFIHRTGATPPCLLRARQTRTPQERALMNCVPRKESAMSSPTPFKRERLQKQHGAPTFHAVESWLVGGNWIWMPTNKLMDQRSKIGSAKSVILD